MADAHEQPASRQSEKVPKEGALGFRIAVPPCRFNSWIQADAAPHVERAAHGSAPFQQ